MTTLEIKNVHKIRGSGMRSHEVLKGVSLEARRGDVILLEGPSGSGKTTLLSLAAGLLLPEEGTVRINAVSIAGLSPSERRSLRLKHIGFVFQDANLLSGLTIYQNVMLAATLAGVVPKLADEATRTLLKKLKIDKRANRFPYELSGGEEQRAAVARALVHGPDLVLADEPTGNLDKASGFSVAEALASIAHANNSSVIIATHDHRLKAVATRLIGIDDGEIHERSLP